MCGHSSAILYYLIMCYHLCNLKEPRLNVATVIFLLFWHFQVTHLSEIKIRAMFPDPLFSSYIHNDMHTWWKPNKNKPLKRSKRYYAIWTCYVYDLLYRESIHILICGKIMDTHTPNILLSKLKKLLTQLLHPHDQNPGGFLHSLLLLSLMAELRDC